jgi:hypothetical protein
MCVLIFLSLGDGFPNTVGPSIISEKQVIGFNVPGCSNLNGKKKRKKKKQKQ